MPDPSLSEAIAEAYACAPSDGVILHTLELRHRDFVDDQGAPMAIRLVRDYVPLRARLEDSAPLDGGQYVTFIALAFEVALPPVETHPVPELTLTIDNVSRELMGHLDAAVHSGDKITLTYRPYLSNDLSGPQMDPPISLVLSQISVDVTRIKASARMLDIGNKRFPDQCYTVNQFPGLARS